MQIDSFDIETHLAVRTAMYSTADLDRYGICSICGELWFKYSLRVCTFSHMMHISMECLYVALMAARTPLGLWRQ